MTQPVGDPKELGRNDPCHCGSKKKYKQCHLAKDEEAARKARAAAASAAAAAEPEAAEEDKKTGPAPKKQSFQPWQGRADTRGFQKKNFQRKSG